MMKSAGRHDLEDLLDREIDVARSLAATLAEERRALTGDSPETLTEKSAHKLRLFENLEKLESERRTLCGVGKSAPADFDFASTVAQRWRALMELIAGCRSANEINGQIIHMRQGQIRQLIDILRGGSSDTYGPQGKTFAKALRALARA
jgi:flagellar biosynthesis/type III secretory pathway chaperone